MAILLPGYSLYEFQERIEEFRDLDIIYAGINRWTPLEQDILFRIDKRFSIIFCGAAPDWYIDETCSFLDRKDENLFITERLNFKADNGQNLVKLFENYNEKLLLFTSYYHYSDFPSDDYPLHFIRENSLSILTALIAIGEPSAIIHFGADGGRISKDGLYYEALNEFIHPDQLDPDSSIKRDTGWFNAGMLSTLEFTRRTHKLGNCEIINCSEKSHLDVFQKLSYNKTIDYLRRIC